MNRIPVVQTYTWHSRDFMVKSVPCGNPRTYVPRIIFPREHEPFVRSVDSDVNVDHKELSFCVAKHDYGKQHKGREKQFEYIHRICKPLKGLH